MNTLLQKIKNCSGRFRVFLFHLHLLLALNLLHWLLLPRLASGSQRSSVPPLLYSISPLLSPPSIVLSTPEVSPLLFRAEPFSLASTPLSTGCQNLLKPPSVPPAPPAGDKLCVHRRSAFAELLICVIPDPGNCSRFMHNNAVSALPICRYFDRSTHWIYRTGFISLVFYIFQSIWHVFDQTGRNSHHLSIKLGLKRNWDRTKKPAVAI